MGIVTGGNVIAATTTNTGIKTRVYRTEGVPTDTAIGVTAANGLLAENVLTGFFYERQAGIWVRIDTI